MVGEAFIEHLAMRVAERKSRGVGDQAFPDQLGKAQSLFGGGSRIRPTSASLMAVTVTRTTYPYLPPPRRSGSTPGYRTRRNS